jgi:inner membrane protein involved in colicin E2 resistance
MSQDNSIDQLKAEIASLKDQLQSIQTGSNSSSRVLTQGEAHLQSVQVIARTIAFVTVFVGFACVGIYVFEKKSDLFMLWFIPLAFGGAIAAINTLIPNNKSAEESKDD